MEMPLYVYLQNRVNKNLKTAQNIVVCPVSLEAICASSCTKTNNKISSLWASSLRLRTHKYIMDLFSV